MVETRPTSRSITDGVRPDVPGQRTPPGSPPRRSDPALTRSRQRIPTLRQLASLVVNGLLTLPRNYYRGMFLDITV